MSQLTNFNFKNPYIVQFMLKIDMEVMQYTQGTIFKKMLR